MSVARGLDRRLRGPRLGACGESLAARLEARRDRRVEPPGKLVRLRQRLADRQVALDLHHLPEPDDADPSRRRLRQSRRQPDAETARVGDLARPPAEGLQRQVLGQEQRGVAPGRHQRVAVAVGEVEVAHPAQRALVAAVVVGERTRPSAY
jgi:hypothetical protein